MNKMEFKNVNGSSIYLEHLFTPGFRNSATEVRISNCTNGAFARWALMTACISGLLLGALQLHHSVGPVLLTVITVTQLILLVYRTHYRVVSEHFLLVAGLGAQVTTTFFTGRSLTLFVPWNSLADVIIAETITMQRVLFYMALLVKKESASATAATCWPQQPQHSVRHQLLPLFMHTWPRLSCLREVYRSCQAVLRGRPLTRPPLSPQCLHSSRHKKQVPQSCEGQ